MSKSEQVIQQIINQQHNQQSAQQQQKQQQQEIQDIKQLSAGIDTKLKITSNTDFYGQGDDVIPVPCSEITNQKLQYILQMLTKYPQICAVYSTRFRKIYFKTKSLCIKPNVNKACTLYELRDQSNKEIDKWKFMNGKTK